MSARWLLDAAALAQASKAVLQNHAALRSQQLNVYARTSSLASSARAQVRESTRTAPPSQESPPRPTIPAVKISRGAGEADAKETGAEQDHHYNASLENSSVEPKQSGSIRVQQEKGPRQPLPDGTLTSPNTSNHDVPVGPSTDGRTLSAEASRKAQRTAEYQIPSQVAKGPNAQDGETAELVINQESEVFHEPATATGPILSSLPRVKVPKNTGTAQEGDDAITSQPNNPDLFYSAKSGGSITPDVQKLNMAGQVAATSDHQHEQIFQNPRVARILEGNRPKQTNPYAASGRVRVQDQPWPPRDRLQPDPADKDAEVEDLARDISKLASQEQPARHIATGEERLPFQMRESRVPSSRFGRMWEYAGLGASMTMGAAAESFRRMTGSESQPGASLMLSSANMERLVAKLSRMRGAALKLGQMLSFQDSKLLPPTIHQVLQRVQDSADYMPASQRNQVLQENLGPNWRDLFSSFEEQPMAAASIGQVHGAVFKSTGERVVVKIQYPGVAGSISSDLNNLSILLTASRLLPKGLYLDKTIANARTELAWECDYVREAEAAKRFRDLLVDEQDTFLVPKMYDEACGKQVLTMQRMEGIGVTKAPNLTQEQNDWIGTQILRLCLREITEFKFMQTDPNWTNFLYNAESQKLELLDFGASRDFADEFIEPYTRILLAASKEDKDACRDLSIKLGYLTGMESKAMLDAHIASIMTLAEPFKDSSPDEYDFRDQTITDRVRAFIPVMLRERLAPPPEETYSLHRKLSGAFLLLARLGARVRCKEMFRDALKKFEAK